MLDKSLVSEVLSVALSRGGEFAELYVENSLVNSINMINGYVKTVQSGVDYGAGLRIFNGFHAIYSYTNDTSRENLLRIAKEAAAALAAKNTAQVLPFINCDIQNRHIVKTLPANMKKKDIVDLLKIASDASFKYSDLITETTESYSDMTKDVLIANSEGLWAEDRRVNTRVHISAVASSETEKQSFYLAPGAHAGSELFQTLDMGELGRKSAESAVTILQADLCPSGKMPVIIGNGFGGVIFHEACGHSLEATAVAKKASVFSERLGQQIASTCVTAIDDGTLENHWGSQNIDDEGTKMQKNILIEDGILKSFLVDRLNGKKMNIPSTGSARRQSYKFAPTSRMTNTFIDRGSDKIKDMIAETEYGLYAKSMGGGSVQPATGEFNFAVREAYMVRNGKIAEAVRGASLIGKGSEVLMNIDRVSDDLEQDAGVCGSISGQVRTNVGQPTIRVKEIAVGGRR